MAAEGEGWFSGALARPLGWHSLGSALIPKGSPNTEELQLRFPKIFLNEQSNYIPQLGLSKEPEGTAAGWRRRAGQMGGTSTCLHMLVEKVQSPAGILFALGPQLSPGAELHSQLVPMLPWTLVLSFHAAISSCCSNHKASEPAHSSDHLHPSWETQLPRQAVLCWLIKYNDFSSKGMSVLAVY